MLLLRIPRHCRIAAAFQNYGHLVERCCQIRASRRKRSSGLRSITSTADSSTTVEPVRFEGGHVAWR